MASPRRDQVRGGWDGGGWWIDNGWPESQARRSVGVHDVSHGFGERSGGSVVG